MLTLDDIKRLTEVLATKENIHGLETRIGSLEGRMEGLEGRMEGLEGRIIRLENTVVEHYKDLRERTDGILKFAEEIENERNENEKRLRKIEAKLNLSPL